MSLNGRKLLERFLPSIVKQSYEPTEVILVDNASTDDSVAYVRTHYPDIKIVRNERNLGTAEGSNVGLKVAAGEYIFWVSNDMELEPGLLSYLVKTASSDRSIGVCTCKMRRITADGTRLMTIDSAGADLDRFGFPSARGINQPDRGQFDESRDIFFAFGGALLIRRSILQEIRGFDPRTFTLGDDIDLCWRVHLRGYRVVVDPRGVLYHRVSATLGTLVGRSKKRFWSERNCMISLIKNYSASSLVRILPKYFGILTAESTFLALYGKRQMSLAVLKAVLWNLGNLRGTMTLRAEVQASRRLNDDEITAMMLKGPLKLGVFKDLLATRHSAQWRNYFGGEG